MAKRKRIAVLLGMGLGSDDSLEIIGAYPTRALAEMAQDERMAADRDEGRKSLYEIAEPLWHTERHPMVQH